MDCLDLSPLGWALCKGLALTSLGWAFRARDTELGFAGLGENGEQKEGGVPLSWHSTLLGWVRYEIKGEPKLPNKIEKGRFPSPQWCYSTIYFSPFSLVWIVIPSLRR